MKVILVSGFLGSGKTAAILSLAKYLAQGWDGSGTRTVILENEIGEVGIDDKLLAAAGHEVKTLLSGCICCTLAGDLTKTLNDAARQYAPDYMVFEPTGVAFPERIASTIRRYGQDVQWLRRVTLVDAARWPRIFAVSPDLMTAQVAGAELVLLNKCDLVDEEGLRALEAQLWQMNPGGKLERVVATRGIGEAVWRGLVAEE